MDDQKRETGKTIDQTSFDDIGAGSRPTSGMTGEAYTRAPDLRRTEMEEGGRGGRSPVAGVLMAAGLGWLLWRALRGSGNRRASERMRRASRQGARQERGMRSSRGRLSGRGRRSGGARVDAYDRGYEGGEASRGRPGRYESGRYGYGEAGTARTDRGYQGPGYYGGYDAGFGRGLASGGGYGASGSGLAYERGGRGSDVGYRDYGSSAYDTDYDRLYGAYGYDTDAFDDDFDDDAAWSYSETWLIAGPHTGRGPQGYTRAAERIQEDAHERLTHHGDLDARNITVRVEGGELTLEGNVDSRRDKRMAEEAVEDIFGVTEVHNRLQVKPQSEQTG